MRREEGLPPSYTPLVPPSFCVREERKHARRRACERKGMRAFLSRMRRDAFRVFCPSSPTAHGANSRAKMPEPYPDLARPRLTAALFLQNKTISRVQFRTLSIRTLYKSRGQTSFSGFSFVLFYFRSGRCLFILPLNQG